jgi:hypothetical protein
MTTLLYARLAEPVLMYSPQNQSALFTPTTLPILVDPHVTIPPQWRAVVPVGSWRGGASVAGVWDLAKLHGIVLTAAHAFESLVVLYNTSTVHFVVHHGMCVAAVWER